MAPENAPISQPTISRDGGAGVVRLERSIGLPPERLWPYLTDPDLLARWWGTVAGDAREGGVVTLTLTTGWSGEGRIERCDAPRELAVRSSDDEGTSLVTARLAPDGDGTLLTIEERGLPLEGLEFYAGAWHLQLDDLASVVDGGTAAPVADRWPALKAELPALVVDER